MSPAPDHPGDPHINALLAKLAAMRDRHKRMQGELDELEDLVRRYCTGENPPPQPPALQPGTQAS
jgi:hypothetical protein